MKIDDQKEDEANTVDKESRWTRLNASQFNNLNNSLDLDLTRNDVAAKRPSWSDNGPKMALKMGFSDMKYLDLDNFGPLIQERTMKKVLQEQK